MSIDKTQARSAIRAQIKGLRDQAPYLTRAEMLDCYLTVIDLAEQLADMVVDLQNRQAARGPSNPG